MRNVAEFLALIRYYQQELHLCRKMWNGSLAFGFLTWDLGWPHF